MGGGVRWGGGGVRWWGGGYVEGGRLGGDTLVGGGGGCWDTLRGTLGGGSTLAGGGGKLGPVGGGGGVRKLLHFLENYYILVAPG